MNFVTGGTGLVGTHLLFELAKAGEKVRAIKRPNSNLDIVRQVFEYYSPSGKTLFDSIEWVDGDILDIYSLTDAMAGTKFVYHCAASVSFDPKDAPVLDKVNVEGTANVVNAALDSNIEKLCHVSSTAAIGRSKSGEHINEKNAWKNSKQNSRYAISKYGAEREVWRGSEEGLKVVLVNPSIIIGPHNWDQSSSAIFKQANKGMKFYAEGVNAFVDVRDVASAMVKLMQSDIDKQRFLVFSENLSFKDFFTYVSAGMGKKGPTIKLSGAVLEMAWMALKMLSWITRKSPVLTKESARSIRNKYYYSHEKLVKAIGFEFTPIKDACESAGKFYLEQLKEKK
jgi:dihydroflavonol-4-reductase